MFNFFKRKLNTLIQPESTTGFEVCWGKINGGLFSVWCAPIAANGGFQSAGISKDDLNDQEWSRKSEALLDDLLEVFGELGEPRLLKTNIPGAAVRDEIISATSGKEVSDYMVVFGDSDLKMRVGNGHHLFWFDIPDHFGNKFDTRLDRIITKWSARKVDLKWGYPMR